MKYLKLSILILLSSFVAKMASAGNETTVIKGIKLEASFSGINRSEDLTDSDRLCVILWTIPRKTGEEIDQAHLIWVPDTMIEWLRIQNALVNFNLDLNKASKERVVLDIPLKKAFTEDSVYFDIDISGKSASKFNLFMVGAYYTNDKCLLVSGPNNNVGPTNLENNWIVDENGLGIKERNKSLSPALRGSYTGSQITLSVVIPKNFQFVYDDVFGHYFYWQDKEELSDDATGPADLSFADRMKRQNQALNNRHPNWELLFDSKSRLFIGEDSILIKYGINLIDLDVRANRKNKIEEVRNHILLEMFKNDIKYSYITSISDVKIDPSQPDTLIINGTIRISAAEFQRLFDNYYNQYPLEGVKKLGWKVVLDILKKSPSEIPPK